LNPLLQELYEYYSRGTSYFLMPGAAESLQRIRNAGGRGARQHSGWLPAAGTTLSGLPAAPNKVAYTQPEQVRSLLHPSRRHQDCNCEQL